MEKSGGRCVELTLWEDKSEWVALAVVRDEYACGVVQKVVEVQQIHGVLQEQLSSK